MCLLHIGRVRKRKGSRAIAREENCPATLKLTLTLTQTLTTTGGQFFSRAIVRIPIKKRAAESVA